MPFTDSISILLSCMMNGDYTIVSLEDYGCGPLDMQSSEHHSSVIPERMHIQYVQIVRYTSLTCMPHF